MHHSRIILSIVALVSGCGAEPGQKSPVAEESLAEPAALQAPAPADSLATQMALINQASPEVMPPRPVAPSKAKIADTQPASLFAIRAQVLLARARFSPGVVDGQFGTNFTHAVAAYKKARGLPATASIDSATWQSLLSEPASEQPAARSYALTSTDVAGPFAADVGQNFVKLADLPAGPQFTTSVEALAERFHMSQALLKALNPGADFNVAGEHIIVVDNVVAPFAKGEVARVDIAKADASVRAYDHADKLLAFYPATVGSTERPSPSGIHKVVGVAWNPDYTYDPAKLAWGPRAAGKLVIKPGPNNPVGSVWIDLNAPGYGLHGTPDPDRIGKTTSHGCVRLTNWDAQALATGIRPGVVVNFVGHRGGPSS